MLPPDVPALVREAFTIGSPPVLTLWEPQRDLLTGDRSPFDPGVRRMVLAVPTSSGKTLIAQMLAVEYLERAGRSVCYVAPTRSLCREVRRAMTSRVRVLQKETGPDLPDFPACGRAVSAFWTARPAGRCRGDDPGAAGPPAPPRRARPCWSGSACSSSTRPST